MGPAPNPSRVEVRIWLLGEFRVAVGGHAVPEAAWRRSKARALVKLLALAPGRRLHREQLMEWLWPDLAPDGAGANLRKAIHFARGALGADAVRVSNDVVRLEATELWIDVDAFEAAAAAGDLASALDLYTDDLLVEDRYEPWCERRRDLLRATAARLLLDHGNDLERRGDRRRAIGALERLVALEPLSEAGHCGLIRLHALDGRRHVALRWYRQLEDRLRAELDVAPSDDARRLCDGILAGELVADAAPPAGAAPSTPVSSVPFEEERKLVTIVVIGLDAGAGGGAPRRRANPEQFRTALDIVATHAADILGRWGARTERQVGGTVVAVFGVPSADEHDVEHALRAALEVAERSSVPVRIGVDTGVVVAPASLRSGLRGLAGEALETAGRLRELAPTGTVLASERSCRVACERFEIDEAEVLHLATGGGSICAHRVRSAHRSGRRAPLLPMVGRDAQLDAVVAVVGNVVTSGRAHLLTLVGTAGIGKSRLVAELLRTVEERWPAVRVQRGRCLSLGDGVTYWALGEIVRETCGISIGQAAGTAQARLQERLGAVLAPLGLADRDVELTIAALAATAGIDVAGGRFGQLPSDAVADELGRAWSRFATALATAGPALLVIEDVHWADDQLLEMLERIVSRVQRPLMVLTTARPELYDAHPGFGARSQAASVISLPPLDPGPSRDLFDGLAEARGLDHTSSAEVLARAEGNPYFIEEMVIHLAERGSSTLPDSLHSLLAARVDALPGREKLVLQEASVMGRTFSDVVLSRRLPSEDVASSLAGLERRGLVAANPAARPGGHEEYTFKHALLRDVAYASVPAARRADGHLAAAAWLEELMFHRDELVELVALHYAAAADELDGAEPEHAQAVRSQAIAALVEAGAAARRRFALGKAVELHQRAFDLATTDIERMRTFEELGEDDEARYRGEAARNNYEAALELARADPACGADRARLCRKYASMMAMNPGSFRELPDPVVVEQLIDEGLATSPDTVNRALLLVARGATARLWSGSEPFGVGTRPDPEGLQTRIDSVDEALRIGEASGRADLVDSAVNTLVILRGLAGDYAGTLALLERTVDRAEEAPSTLARADILRTAAVHLIDMSARYDDGLELARRAYALTREAAGPHQLMHVTYPLLVALYHLGRWDEMDALLHEHVTAFRAEPAVHCHFVRDGALVGAVLQLRRGDLAAAAQLTALVRDASPADAVPSAWDSFLEAIGDEPATAVALSAQKMLDGRTYGPQHQLAVLEAEVALGHWDAVRTMLARARADVAGNALLGPWCDRAAGLAAAADANRPEAARSLSRALRVFERLGLRFEAARTREELAALRPATRRRTLLRAALAAYEELGAAPSADRVRTLLDQGA